MRSPIDQALGSRYTIERELGAGGMATVYLATDRRHDRPVAIKVLRPDLAETLGADRFAREISLLARLRHPFILPLHDSGEADGTLYYVMPYVEGESLGGRLRRVGRLSVPEAVSIAREVADALSYAHAEGVIHRDIKPENILLSRQGHALLADFGIARGHDPGGGRVGLTGVGLTIGTPMYMSPEQGFGDAGIDGRSDIYSLAVTVYEMLAGRPPFSVESPVAIAIQHLTAPVPSLASTGVRVPPPIETALTRALAKEPADRFQTAADFAAALAYPARGPATTAVAAAPPPVASVVVLPFSNIGGERENEYLSDGITEELIGALARVGGFRVTSRTSAFAFKGRNVPLREIGSTLNVSFALEGSLRRFGDQIRVTVQLIRVSDDTSLWAESYQRQLADVFAVQDEIANRIVTTLTRTLRLTPVDTPDPVPKPSCLEAYNSYLLGRYHWNKRTGTGLQRALELFRQAIDADPDYAPAHSGVADALALLASRGNPLPELYEEAGAAARRALELDDSLAEGHASLGFLKLHAEWDWEGAERELRQALAINPFYTTANQWLSTFLAGTNRFEEALPLAECAVQTDPLSILARVNLGNVNFFGGRPEEARVHYAQALQMEPQFFSALVWMATVEAQLGMADEALGRVAEIAKLSPSAPERVATMEALVMAILGRREEALAAIDVVLEKPVAYPLFIAMVHAQLGNEAEAFEWLDRAYDAHFDWMYSLPAQPAFAAFRDHPRFVALIERLGLARWSAAL